MVRLAWSRWVVCAALALAGAGCNEERDLGRDCELVRRSADGGLDFVLNGDIKTGQEFISFGAAKCEDLICLRDTDFVSGSTEPGGTAMGYCSTACTPQPEGSLIDPCATGRSADDAPGSATKLSCRQMLLDDETLSAIKESNPALYDKYFGTAKSASFCARGDGQPGSADAGQ